MPGDIRSYLTSTAGQNFSGTNTYNGTAYDSVNGTPREGVDIEINVSSVVNTYSSTAGTIEFKIQDSDDNSTWTDRVHAECVTEITITNPNTATAARKYPNVCTANGQCFAHLETPMRYWRVVGIATIGTGGSPVFTGNYVARVVTARP